jgi:hypothetical protein
MVLCNIRLTGAIWNKLLLRAVLVVQRLYADLQIADRQNVNIDSIRIPLTAPPAGVR